MEVLLDEKAKMIDSSLLHELFLQRLLSNIQMILASAIAMTIDKLAEMANRIMDVGTPTISSVSRPTEGGDVQGMIQEEIAAALRTQNRSLPDFLLSGIKVVGTVHIGVPVRVANCLSKNRQIKRESPGTISNLVKTPESAA